MQSFSFRLPKEEEEKLPSPHEYVRDTLPLDIIIVLFVEQNRIYMYKVWLLL
jgi:hypothetical protein